MKQLTMPGRMHRLKRYIAAQLPAHAQSIPAGTVYFAELTVPLDLGCGADDAADGGVDRWPPRHQEASPAGPFLPGGGHGPFYPPYLLVLLVLVAPFPAIAFASPNQSLKQQFLKSAWPETEVACFEREVRRFVR